jgi:phosphoribosyl 1,2-cyclic phosphodiesterase
MVLKVLGSGSSGNTYLLENETECLVIEAGLPFLEVKKALDFNIRKIVGVVVGHVHLDHSRYISEYEKAGIPVYKPYDGMETMSMPSSEFIIRAFDLVHDVPCFGFHICHPEIGNLLYASDTEYIKYKFKGLNNILIEANYSMNFVDKDKPNYGHVLQGHMNIDTTCKFLEVNNSPMLRNVILCHLSNENADREDFINQAEKVVDCPVYVAEKGLQVNMDLVPF